MFCYRSAELVLDQDEWFDAAVPTRESNAGGVLPFRRIQVRQIVLRDDVDGAAPTLHADGRWYKADGELSGAGRARSTLPWDQMPEQIRFEVARVLATYRASGGAS